MRRANRPVVDEEGCTNVTIAKVERKTFEDLKAMKKGLPPDECRYVGYDVELVCEGLTGEFRIRERCGSVINDSPVSTKYRGTVKTYNKLTSLLLALGLLTEETLSTADPEELEKGLLGMEGTAWNVKVVKVDGFYRADLSSLKAVE